jgi:hypothetical protein
VSEEEVLMVIKKDIEQRNLGEDADDCDIEVQNDEIYDLESFQAFKDDIYAMFDCYADEKHGEKQLDLIRLNKLQNPDIQKHIERLNWLINDLQYESPHGSNILTLDDLDDIVRKYDEFLKQHYKDKD